MFERYRAYRKQHDVDDSPLVRAARAGEPTPATRASTLSWWCVQAATGVVVGVIAVSMGGVGGYLLALVFFGLAVWSVHMVRRLILATRRGK